MKHLLLSLLLSAGAFAGSANAPDASLRLINGSDMVKEHNIKAGSNAKTRQLAPGVFVTESHGMKKVIINRDNAPGRQLPPPVKISTKAQKTNGLPLFESFEGWDGTDAEWTPEGWVVDMRGEVERKYSWTPSPASANLPSPSDGDCFYGISYSTSAQDEWLISPLTKVDDGMNLTFWIYLAPAYLFSFDNIDWDSPTYEYIGDQIVTATLQVWAQAEGEEWTMLHDYADDYKGKSYLELAYLQPTDLEKKSISLKQFSGKNIKIAFRYVGADGDTMLIDAISIGYPPLDNVSYLEPFSTLYWGFNGDPSLTGLEGAIAMQPVLEPITWINNSDEEGVVYQWTYSDPSTAAPVTSDNQEELSVTYFPDYSSESRMVNNFYYPPTLSATLPGSLPGTYTSPYALLQAGGKPERMLADNSKLELDLFPFAPQNTGIIYTTVDDPVIGDNALPVFGYNVNTDRYWLNYSLNGEEPNASDYSHLEGIANLIFPNAAPLVVHGVNIYAYGKIGADVNFTATVYAMNSEMNRDLSTMEVIATATIKGSQVLNEGSNLRGFLALNFDFESPAVIKSSREHPAYLIMLTGFRSQDIEYFAPLQSFAPDPNYMCFGYTYHHIDMSSQTGRPEYWNLKPMVYKEDGNYVDPYSAFAFGLKAEYPWLTTEEDNIELTDGNRTAELALGSYYDGSQLTVAAPEGITASVAGRYNKCVLTAEHSDLTKDVDGNITVKGHGVELEIPVKASASAGIADIVADGGRGIEGTYDLFGRKVSDNTAAGVYIIRYTDGTSEKTIVR